MNTLTRVLSIKLRFIFGGGGSRDFSFLLPLRIFARNFVYKIFTRFFCVDCYDSSLGGGVDKRVAFQEPVVSRDFSFLLLSRIFVVYRIFRFFFFPLYRLKGLREEMSMKEGSFCI